jgi:hypothetical protein
VFCFVTRVEADAVISITLVQKSRQVSWSLKTMNFYFALLNTSGVMSQAEQLDFAELLVKTAAKK